MKTDEEFYLTTAYALGACQMLEQEIKLYISEALQVVHRYVSGKIPFKMCGDDYLDSSLERLIEMFKKLSDNDELIRRLKTFKDNRNFLAHRSISACLDYDGDLFLPKSEETLHLLTSIQEEASMLRSAIRYEAQRFHGDLYFDAIPDA